MRLTDLNPWLVGYGGEGVTDSATGKPIPRREGVGVGFDCPCGCGEAIFVPFANPLDGGPAIQRGWVRTGETMETLTLTPSILRLSGCRWHGWVTRGTVLGA